ncbi:MAG: protein phosphatase CheZ [Leptospirales bacterium]
MQILSFPTRNSFSMGVRISDVLKILPTDSLLAAILGEQSTAGTDVPPTITDGGRNLTVYDPRNWDLPGTPISGFPSKLLVIGTHSGTRLGIAILKMGKVLRVREEDIQSSQTDSFLPAFLLPGKTTEGTPILIFDPELFLQSGKSVPSGTETIPAPLPGEPNPSSDEGITADDLISQVGKTAREIQKILALSDSMIDTMKAVENHLPMTSGALETVSRMTEEAAHTILGILEASLNTTQEVRSRLAEASRDPSLLSEHITAINVLLAAEETRINQGFEAMVFQDLVGQNIRKMTGTLNDLEKKLLAILVEFSPGPSPEEGDSTGPSTPLESLAALELKGIPDSATVSQDAVDKLLLEFGF